MIDVDIRRGRSVGNDRYRNISKVDVFTRRLKVLAIAPQNVRLAVAVVISERRKLPSQVGHGAQIALGRLDGGAIHRIKIVASGDEVSPDNIGLAIAIEIADARDLPALIRDGAYETFAGYSDSVHQVNVVLPRSRVPP